MSPTDRPLKRFDRARLHLEELHSEIERFRETEPKPYDTTREPDPDSGGFRFRLTVKAAVPDSIGLIFGDFVHNLRASLDNFVWELAVQTPLPSEAARIGVDPRSLLSVRPRRRFRSLRTLIAELCGCKPIVV